MNDTKVETLDFDTQRKAEWIRQQFVNVRRRYECSDVRRMYVLGGKPEFRFTVREIHAGTCGRQFDDGDSWTVTVTRERNGASKG